MSLPLSKYRVLELQGLAPSLFSGMILADYGAEVVLLCRPDPPALGVPIELNYMNRGKKAIMLSLKDKSHLQAVKKIVETSDVLIDPYRPGVLEKLGLGPKDCLQINPKLIYARLSGYGQTGDYSLRAGHDLNYLSLSGMLSTFGPKEGVPTFPANLLADFAGGGAMCVLGILVALAEREKTGKGQVVDVSMMDSVMYLGSFIHNMKRHQAWNNPRGENLLDSGAPFYKVYKCKDGKYLAVGSLEAKFFEGLIKGLDLGAELSSKFLERQLDFSVWPEMEEAFRKKISEKTRDEWTTIFNSIDACVTPVTEIEELLNDRHALQRRMVFKRENDDSDLPENLKFEIAAAPKLSLHPELSLKTSKPPIPGQNNYEVLKKIGLSDGEISKIAVDMDLKPKL